jgi:hypothetical protein
MVAVKKGKEFLKSSNKAASKGADSGEAKRRLGLKGAAPWAARHAAKHAAEARARAAEPPRPGSARATIRTPDGAANIKERLNDLLRQLETLRSLRRSVPKNFFEIGAILRDIQAKRLYETRGYTSFETFVDRESELGKDLGIRLTRVATLFTRDGALEIGLDRAIIGVIAIDQTRDCPSDTKIAAVPPAAVRIVEPSGRAL